MRHDGIGSNCSVYKVVSRDIEATDRAQLDAGIKGVDILTPVFSNAGFYISVSFTFFDDFFKKM